jgi:hypothetical protein
MAGMKFKAFPLMGTCFFGSAFLLATLWHSIFRDGWGFLIFGILFGLFAIFACGTLVIALVDWSKVAWQRCLIIVSVIGLFVPTMILGGHLRNQIFLAELPIYQKITDILVSQVQYRASDTTVCFPPGYTSNLVNDQRALIERSDDNSITVLYFTRDSSALGHSGFMYRSDDHPDVLKMKRPEMGFKRIAPKWFVWGT